MVQPYPLLTLTVKIGLDVHARTSTPDGGHIKPSAWTGRYTDNCERPLIQPLIEPLTLPSSRSLYTADMVFGSSTLWLVGVTCSRNAYFGKVVQDLHVST
jgi:hypothetical protein